MPETSIGDFALLPDRQSAALVRRDGSVDSYLKTVRKTKPSSVNLGSAAKRW